MVANVQPNRSALLKHLRNTLTEAPPFCSGTLQLPRENFEFYYGKKQTRYIDFVEAAQDPSSVGDLQRACEAAPFGRNEETVLDETYRKADKMDAGDFVMRFDVERSGLIDVVRQGLLTESEERKGVRAELYKLNVYGHGAFFKPHLDTPRSEDMFGSLVVVLLTPQQGGDLILRHEEKEWTFRSDQLLAGQSDRIAFVVFFSDVEHEVMPVLSGHRVTLTYNLHFEPDDVKRPHAYRLSLLEPRHANAGAIKDALLAYLSNPEVLTNGGTLGFGLRHVYPVSKVGGDPMSIVKKGLKGSDAALYQACNALGLTPKLRLFLNEEAGSYMFSSMKDLTENTGDSCKYFDRYDDVDEIHNERLSEDLEAADASNDSLDYGYGRRSLNGTQSAYVCYDNDACLDHFYVEVALVAQAKLIHERLAEWGAEVAGDAQDEKVQDSARKADLSE
ncbi:hypothetical protein BN946_scf185044.g10 [Trametes cinnabarina]|uniref:Fe2OG dioxygenase domain-containing protein n=1 Tax=Pycnoporus cinnabarinus TaxID=5643 RepID=A0A060S164_PYCCI|nr:hypothetical protein BN946_scf185044.g10 [Trametes cinnabarina]